MYDPQNAFKALADPTRREILHMLSARDMSIQEVCERFEMTRAAVKKHLGVLENGRLISVHQKGRERINKLEPQGLKSVAEWLSYFEQFWNTKLDALQDLIETEHEKTDE